MHSMLVVASVSKTPFYIAGLAFAAWAVIVSALGLTRPTFPGNGGGARAVMAISAVLMVAAIATGIHSSTFEGLH